MGMGMRLDSTYRPFATGVIEPRDWSCVECVCLTYASFARLGQEIMNK